MKEKLKEFWSNREYRIALFVILVIPIVAIIALFTEDVMQLAQRFVSISYLIVLAVTIVWSWYSYFKGEKDG